MANARVIRIIEKEKDLTTNGQKTAANTVFCLAFFLLSTNKENEEVYPGQFYKF